MTGPKQSIEDTQATLKIFRLRLDCCYNCVKVEQVLDPSSNGVATNYF